MFIVGEGIIDVHIHISQTKKDRVACLVVGEYFGEMALLCGEKRSATVTARTDVILFEIQRSTIKSFMQQYQDFAEKLSLSIAKRQATNLDFTIESIAQKNNEEKTASELKKVFLQFLWDK
jgi:CRP-like cAMP-binding protein